MPVLIEDYFKSLLDLIISLPFVENPQVNLEKRAETVGFIRGDIEFIDGSLLHFRELIDLRLPLRLVMYAYHYQLVDGTLIFRYDNASHHMKVSTFPHHKHTHDGEIISANEIRLEVVLREIESEILSSSEDKGSKL
jgi:Family of unknown function (DUF6516)